MRPRRQQVQDCRYVALRMSSLMDDAHYVLQDWAQWRGLQQPRIVALQYQDDDGAWREAMINKPRPAYAS
ncbi:MAG: hypothetical protein N2690_00425 [Rhodocyclaceae bacterium]|nr:hypothetical protein [Rhodocyclaceae bacterium]